MPKLPTPQVIIFLDDGGNIRAEAIGQNGQRRKIDLGLDFAARAYEIADDLDQQESTNRERAKAELRETQNANIKYVVESHGTGVAKKVWPNADLIFNRSLQRALSETNLGTYRAPSEKSQTNRPNMAVPLDD